MLQAGGQQPETLTAAQQASESLHTCLRCAAIIARSMLAGDLRGGPPQWEHQRTGLHLKNFDPAAAAKVQGVHVHSAQPWHQSFLSFCGICPRPDSRDALLVEVLQPPLPRRLPQRPTALIHLQQRLPTLLDSCACDKSRGQQHDKVVGMSALQTGRTARRHQQSIGLQPMLLAAKVQALGITGAGPGQVPCCAWQHAAPDMQAGRWCRGRGCLTADDQGQAAR